MRKPVKQLPAGRSENDLQEFRSLARLILFARQTADDLGSDFSSYLLDLAHGAVQEEIQEIQTDVDMEWARHRSSRGTPIN